MEDEQTPDSVIEKINKYERELSHTLPTTRHNLNNAYALPVGVAELINNPEMQRDVAIARNLTMILLVQAELLLSGKKMTPGQAKTIIFQELYPAIKDPSSLVGRTSDIAFREKVEHPEKIMDYENPHNPDIDNQAKMDYLEDKIQVLKAMRSLGVSSVVTDQIAELNISDLDFFRLSEIMSTINGPLVNKIKKDFAQNISQNTGDDFVPLCVEAVAGIPEILRETEPFIYEPLEDFVGTYQDIAKIKLQSIVGNYSEDKKPYIRFSREEEQTFPVRIKPGAFVAVLDNLLSNSIKYSPVYQDYQIGIDVRLKRSGDNVILSWQDRGLGLSPEDLPKIFVGEKVEDEATAGIVSTRLGLPDCKRIIENLGGQISAESAGRGQGTTINIALPIATETVSLEKVPELAVIN